MKQLTYTDKIVTMECDCGKYIKHNFIGNMTIKCGQCTRKYKIEIEGGIPRVIPNGHLVHDRTPFGTGNQGLASDVHWVLS